MDLSFALDVLQIIYADIILSGDNALVIGMAAASLSPELRKRAIIVGMTLAAGLRIFFAIIAVYLLQIPGIQFVGGLLLAWVCWRFFCELREGINADAEEALSQKGYQGSPRRQFWQAMGTITLADVSMSLDNVLVVAAIADKNTGLLIFGLVFAILIMALCATLIMRVMAKYPWIAWGGLIFLVYVTAKMLLKGWPEVAQMIM